MRWKHKSARCINGESKRGKDIREIRKGDTARLPNAFDLTGPSYPSIPSMTAEDAAEDAALPPAMSSI